MIEQTHMNMTSYLTPEKIVNEISEYVGWTPHLNQMSGVLEWTHPNKSIVIMATPSWNDENQTPIDYLDAEENYHTLGVYMTSTVEEYEFALGLIFKYFE